VRYPKSAKEYNPYDTKEKTPPIEVGSLIIVYESPRYIMGYTTLDHLKKIGPVYWVRGILYSEEELLYLAVDQQKQSWRLPARGDRRALYNTGDIAQSFEEFEAYLALYALARKS
jgi:hypothetical protein